MPTRITLLWTERRAVRYVIESLDTSLFFSVSENWEGKGWINVNGAVITDSNGLVIGLLGSWYSSLCCVYRPHWLPPLAISTTAALALMSEEAVSEVRANGPVQMLTACLTPKGGNNYWLSPLSDTDYIRLATAIQNLLSHAGQPITTTDTDLSIVNDYHSLQSEDGIFLTTVFAKPVILRDNQGNILASAIWVCFQWDRSDGKPNRIIYGTTPYVVDGVFEADQSAADLMTYFPLVLRQELLNS